MNLVSNTLLLSAGLLASPALAEVTRLRGSAKADMAAEEDRAALRALQDAFSVPLPEFPDLPEIVPGMEFMLPPGAVITNRADTVTKTLSAESSLAGEITSFNFGLLGDPENPDGVGSSFGNQKVAREGSVSEFQVQDISGEFDSNGDLDEISEFKQTSIEERGEVAGELTNSNVTALFPGEISGYYYGIKAAGSASASEFRVQGSDHDETGPINSYYYEVKTANDDFADEINSHQYDIDFATTAAPP